MITHIPNLGKSFQSISIPSSGIATNTTTNIHLDIRQKNELSSAPFLSPTIPTCCFQFHFICIRTNMQTKPPLASSTLFYLQRKCTSSLLPIPFPFLPCDMCERGLGTKHFAPATLRTPCVLICNAKTPSLASPQNRHPLQTSIVWSLNHSLRMPSTKVGYRFGVPSCLSPLIWKSCGWCLFRFMLKFFFPSMIIIPYPSIKKMCEWKVLRCFFFGLFVWVKWSCFIL